ncbi:MAG: prepilin peptidase [Deltaproteobacteria bacterium]|nr:prepilin peptidase [Deltaproteobacteria bacterium]
MQGVSLPVDNFILIIIPFLFGAVVGSFLNVCIYRLPLGMSIVTPPSSCPNCGSRVPFYLNVPILSYLVLAGKCSSCKVSFSARYPAVEALTGLMAVFTFMKFGPSTDALIYFSFISALIVITFIDLDLQIIPDVISLPGIVLGFAASFVLFDLTVLESAIGLIVGGGILFLIAFGYHLITGHEGMGGGDIKLLAMIGAFLGWKGVLLTLLLSSFTGAITGGVLMYAFGKGGRYAIPFGPFLALGAVLHLFFGEKLISWYIMRASGF